jgi:hypothetical protein
MCYLSKPSNTSHFVPQFLAHEDVVVRISIFYIELSTPRLACFICSSLILQGSWSDHCNLKSKKRRKKGTPPWFVKVGGHPMESVSHGLWKEKWGWVPSFIKEHQCAYFQRTRNRSHLFSMEDSKNPLPVVDMKQPPLKANFYLCFTNEKL